MTIDHPIASGIEERRFVSSYDGSEQTYLEKNFGEDAPKDFQRIVIYLHGAASHQTQGMTAGIYKDAFSHWAEDLAQRKALYICPEYRGGSWMGPAAESDVKEIIQQIRERGFKGKLILAGGSMGGTSALIFASRFPEMIDGVIALCPATDPTKMYSKFSEQFELAYGGSPEEVPEVYAERSSRDFVENLSGLPVYLVHGAKDALIDVEHSRILVERFKHHGVRYQYKELPEGDHDEPIQAPLGEMLDFVLCLRE